MPVALHHQREARVIGGIDTFAGLWLFTSSFMFAGQPAIAWNFAICGGIVTVLAASRAVGVTRAWPSWLNLLIGLWVVASPWVLVSGPSVGVQWDAVVTGLIIANLALASAMATDTVPIG